MNDSAVSVTVYTTSGDPISPVAVAEMEQAAEYVAKKHKLLVNIAKG